MLTLSSVVGDLGNSLKPENLNLTSKFVVLNLTLKNVKQNRRYIQENLELENIRDYFIST